MSINLNLLTENLTSESILLPLSILWIGVGPSFKYLQRPRGNRGELISPKFWQHFLAIFLRAAISEDKRDLRKLCLRKLKYCWLVYSKDATPSMGVQLNRFEHSLLSMIYEISSTELRQVCDLHPSTFLYYESI